MQGRLSLFDLRRPLGVYREGLCADPEIAVRMGPIVGKVTSTSAVVLLEVDSPGDIRLNVAPVRDGAQLNGEEEAVQTVSWSIHRPLSAKILRELVFGRQGAASLIHRLEPGRPYSMLLEGLEPNTGYVLFVSNVREEDVEGRVARFKTLPEQLQLLRLVAVAGHQSPPEGLGANSPWMGLHRLACAGPEVHVVVHVGSTANQVPAVEEASRMITDIGSFCEGARRDVERLAKRALRAAHSSAWGHAEGLRRVMAEVGAHLPLFTPLLDGDAMLEKPLEDSQALLRIAVDVSREYCRALWHVDDEPDVRLDVSRGKNPLAYAVSQDSEEGSTLPEYWHEGGNKTSTGIEEWHFHWYGATCIFMLDTKGNILGNLGQSRDDEGQTLLSAAQWQALESVLSDDTTQFLVLCCETPFLFKQATSNRSTLHRVHVYAYGATVQVPADRKSVV